MGFYLIELEGCDAILGAQWLKTLGPITWNFETIEMGFSVGKKEIRLVGIGHLELRLVGLRMVHKTLEKNKGKGMLLQIHLVGEGQKLGGEEWEPWVQKYPAVFGEIIGLPPKRDQDHRIPLLQRMGPVNVKPYRYPHYQKQEIEKIVRDMLEQGIIQVSRSPYSSLVLLVRK